VPAADVRCYRGAHAGHGGFGYYRADGFGRENDLAAGRADCEPRHVEPDRGTGSAGRDAGFARRVDIDLRGNPRADRDRASDTDTDTDYGDHADHADHPAGSHRRVPGTDRRHIRRHGHTNPGRHASGHGDQRSRRTSDRHGTGPSHRQQCDVDRPIRFTRHAG
jgi:hypothetical protein